VSIHTQVFYIINFWAYYAKEKYGVTEKYIRQTWKDWIFSVNITYNGILREKDRKLKDDIYNKLFHKALWSEHRKKYPRFIIDNKLKIYYYLYGHLKVIPSVSDKFFIDMFVYHERFKTVIFLIELDGTLHYNLDGSSINMEFNIIPNIRAYRVTNGYIMQKDGIILEYDLSFDDTLHQPPPGELGLRIKYKPFITPVEMKYISNYDYETNIVHKNKHSSAIFSIDLDGRVWVKNRKFINTLTGKKTKLELLDFPVKIKRIISNGPTTVFVDIENDIWVMKIKDDIPQGINPVYQQNTKKKSISNIRLKIIDVAIVDDKVNFIGLDINNNKSIYEVKFSRKNIKGFEIIKKNINLGLNPIVKYVNSLLNEQIFYTSNS